MLRKIIPKYETIQEELNEIKDVKELNNLLKYNKQILNKEVIAELNNNHFLNNPDIILTLIRKDINLDLLDDDIFIKIIKIIIKNGNNSDYNTIIKYLNRIRSIIGDYNLLLYCINNITLLKLLKDIDLSTHNKENETILFEACRKNNLEIIKYIIENGCSINNINNKGDNALFYCISYESCLMLIEAGININVVDDENWSAFEHLCMLDNPEMIILLIKSGADIIHHGSYGYYTSHKNIFLILLEHNVNIHNLYLVDDDLITLLMLVCMRDWVDMALLLLERNINTIYRDAEGNTIQDYLTPYMKKILLPKIRKMI